MNIPITAVVAAGLGWIVAAALLWWAGNQMRDATEFAEAAWDAARRAVLSAETTVDDTLDMAASESERADAAVELAGKMLRTGRFARTTWRRYRAELEGLRR